MTDRIADVIVTSCIVYVIVTDRIADVIVTCSNIVAVITAGVTLVLVLWVLNYDWPLRVVCVFCTVLAITDPSVQDFVTRCTGKVIGQSCCHPSQVSTRLLIVVDSSLRTLHNVLLKTRSLTVPPSHQKQTKKNKNKQITKHIHEKTSNLKH